MILRMKSATITEAPNHTMKLGADAISVRRRPPSDLPQHHARHQQEPRHCMQQDERQRQRVQYDHQRDMRISA